MQYSEVSIGRNISSKKEEIAMEKVEEFFTVEALSVICAILQIVGFILIIFRVAPVIIGVCGFAAVVRIFLPLPQNRTPLGYTAALAGLGIIILHAI